MAYINEWLTCILCTECTAQSHCPSGWWIVRGVYAQISAVIVNNDETRIRDHLSGKNYKCAELACFHMLPHAVSLCSSKLLRC